MSIPHGALCDSEVCDCGVAFLVLCLFLTASCVALKSVIAVCLLKVGLHSKHSYVRRGKFEHLSRSHDQDIARIFMGWG